MKRITILYCFFLMLISSAMFAQTIESLKLNEQKTVYLEAGQAFKYHVSLKKGQHAAIKVKQKSVGISYAVYSPKDSLMCFDDFNAINQTEIINIMATETGNYRVEIFWDYGRPQKGEFIIVWDTLEETGNTPKQKADQLMKSWYSQNEPGAAVVVLKNNQVVYKNAIGLANMEYKLPLTSSTSFELASCSKQFTGFAIAMLIDKGLISLEDDIKKYFPELPDFGKKITIENLVYHTSGLRNSDAMRISMGMHFDDITTTDMVYKILCSTTELNFTPGERYSYSNPNYNLLAMIIEKVTQQKFSDWMNENIFRPLDMKNTHIKDDIKKLIPNKASSYKEVEYGFDVNVENFTEIGSASVYSSIDDLAKWVNNFSTKKVGGEKVFQLLNRKTKLNNGEEFKYYAFGNGFGSHKGTYKIEHLGLVLGYRTAIVRYPDQNLAIVYLSNDNNDVTYSRYWKVANLFLQNLKSQPLNPVKFPDLNEFLAKTMPLKVEKCPVETKEYEGHYYADEMNIHYKLINQEGILTLVTYRFDYIYLKWEKADIFSSNYEDYKRGFEFIRDNDGKITSFKLTGGEKGVLFKKM